MAVATLTLVPALAQQDPEPPPEPYVELLAGIDSATQYIRFVDGDAATADPQQGFASLAPLTVASDPGLLTIGAAADPATVLAGTGCLVGGQPIGPLPPVTPAHFVSRQLDWIPPQPFSGVTSYRCVGTAPPQIVPEDSKALIKPGERLVFGAGADLPLDFRRLTLSVVAEDTSAVRVTGLLAGSVVGTIDVDIDVDCVPSTVWGPDLVEGLCTTKVVPFFGALRQRYLKLDFGGAFDSFELTATSGTAHLGGVNPSRFYLDGEVFGGTIGGETGEEAVSEPPTDELPGYEVSCADAADPPPEGPCGGKEVSLTIVRFRADVDDDGDDEQVLHVLPSGPGEDLVRLALTTVWAPEDAPVGVVPLTRFDEDEAGPDDDDPASWCSVDPPGAPGDQWCLDAFTSESAGDGKIQVSEVMQGTGDPRQIR